jgi:hypothetical protein
MYSQMMEKAGFTEAENYQKWYGKDPMHKMFIGRIKAVYERV